MLNLKLIRGNELAEGVAAEMRLPQEFKRFSIGRDPGNQWPIPDRTRAISARHCEIVTTPSGPALRDVSTNGTFVNGGAVRLAGDHLLRDGDQIQMGPFVIEVQDPRGPGPLPTPPARAIDLPLPNRTPPATAPAPRTPSGRPLRGGDPAAMFASGTAPERIGLTQLLLNTPKGETWSDDVTRIRAAPRGGAMPPSPAPAPVAPAPSFVNPPTEAISPALMAQWAAAQPTPPTVPAQDPGADSPWLAHLAAGLGLPHETLASHDAAELAHQVGALARAGVAALQHLLEQEAQARRRAGGRGLAPLPAHEPEPEPEPWRVAASPEAALQALLLQGGAAQASVQRAATELVAHQARLLAAWVQLATAFDVDAAARTGKGGSQ